MAFTLTVDSEKFRKHTALVVSEYGSAGATVLPVIKGNGYGFSRRLLSHEVTRLGLKQLAVGTVWELEQALSDFAGEVRVLEPFTMHDSTGLAEWKRLLEHNAPRVIVTVSDKQLVAATQAGAQKVFLEGSTSMHRFGMQPHEMSAALDEVGHQVVIVGLSLHLPIADPTITHVAILESSQKTNARVLPGRVLEVIGWLGWYRELAEQHGLAQHVSLSHMTSHEVKQLQEHFSFDGFTCDVRIGTSLWLGAPDALAVTGTVLAIHEMGMSHTRVGYNQIDSHGHKRLVVVSGGTSHGVALASPVSTRTIRKRVIALSEGLFEAVGKVRSPFTWKRDNLVFAELPHMHVSLLWCEDTSIAVGDVLPCAIRNTVATFDRVIGLD